MPDVETVDILDLTDDEIMAAIKKYRPHPLKFKDEVLQSPKFTDKQEQVFNDLFKYKKLAVSTHNAFGKSFIAANAVLTIYNLYPAKIKGAAFAPTFPQIRDILFSEMHSIYDNAKEKTDNIFPLGKISTTRYEIHSNAFFVGRSPRVLAKGSATTSQAVQGLHAPTMVIVVDEAAGVNRQIFEQIEKITNTAGNVFVLYIGNPLDINSYFGSLFHSKEGEGWHLLQFLAYESPNMVANGLTSINAIKKEAKKIKALPDKKRKEYYENKHYKIVNPALLSAGYVIKAFIRWGLSPLFLSGVIGSWTTTPKDAMVTLKRINQLMAGIDKDNDGNIIYLAEEMQVAKWDGSKTINIGIDAARSGADSVVVTAVMGNKEIYKRKFAKTYIVDDRDYKGERLLEDGGYICGEVKRELISQYPMYKFNLQIDCGGGYGDTIYDAFIASEELDKKFFTIRGTKFNEVADDEKTYNNKATEINKRLADDINSEYGILFIDEDLDLKNALTDRRIGYDNKSRFKIESKDEFKIRGGSSPDEMDSLALANDCRYWQDEIFKAADKKDNTTLFKYKET